MSTVEKAGRSHGQSARENSETLVGPVGLEPTTNSFPLNS